MLAGSLAKSLWLRAANGCNNLERGEDIANSYYPPREISGSNAGLAILDYSTKLAQYVHTPDA